MVLEPQTPPQAPNPGSHYWPWKLAYFASPARNCPSWGLGIPWPQKTPPTWNVRKHPNENGVHQLLFVLFS